MTVILQVSEREKKYFFAPFRNCRSVLLGSSKREENRSQSFVELQQFKTQVILGTSKSQQMEQKGPQLP